MVKFVILLVSMASLATAGVLDNRWMGNNQINQFNDIRQEKSIRRIDNDPIQRLSSNDLLKQKFLLKVLDHVNEPTMDDEILQNSDNFDFDQNNYKEGIDEDMMYVIDLCRNSRLLGKNQIYTISNPEHTTQMAGLKKLLARSRDWQTFKKNLCCARQNANGVLFVNALLLALRERDDCRNLIVPGIHEILPELYLNKNTVRKVRSLDINLLTQTNERGTIRTKLFDMIGFGGLNNKIGMQRYGNEGIMHEMRMQNDMQNNQYNGGLVKAEFEDKIVIQDDKNMDSNRNTNLLTEDVGLKGFLHLMMNDLCLRENELKKRGTGRLDSNRYNRKTIFDRQGLSNNNNWNDRYNDFENYYNDNEDMKTFDTRKNRYRNGFGDEFEFNTNRDKFATNDWINQKYNDHRYNKYNELNDFDRNDFYNTDRENFFQNRKQNTRDRFMNILQRRSFNDMDNQRFGGRDQDDIFGNKDFGGYRNRFVGDIRRVKDNDFSSLRRNDIWNKCNGNGDCFDDILQTNKRRNNRYINDNYDNDFDIRNRGKGKALESDILLHNIKQTLARIEIDEISMVSNYDNDYPNQMTYRRTNEGRGLNLYNKNQIDIGVLNEVENKIQYLLTQVNNGGKGGNGPMNVDRQISDILIGKQGKTNVVNIIRDLVDATGNVQRNEDSLKNLGVDLENTYVKNVLRRMNEAVDEYRTNILGPYTSMDLGLDGVTINDVTVDDLKTTVDQKDIDIRNLLDSRTDLDRTDQKMVVVKEQRLNHKDFEIKIDLNCDRDRRVIVRTMLGPKLTDSSGRELTLDERRQDFVLIDTNIVDLQAGKNVIKRKSRDITWTARDTTPYTKIYKRVMGEIYGEKSVDDDLPATNVAGQDCRFPHRLLLPRGRRDGLKMQLLVIVTELEGNTQVRKDMTCAMGVGSMALDHKSLGFPLDRRIVDIREWMTLPNLRVFNVAIRHENKKTGSW